MEYNLEVEKVIMILAFLELITNCMFSVENQVRNIARIFIALMLKIKVGKFKKLKTKSVCLRDQNIQL